MHCGRCDNFPTQSLHPALPRVPSNTNKAKKNRRMHQVMSTKSKTTSVIDHRDPSYPYRDPRMPESLCLRVERHRSHYRALQSAPKYHGSRRVLLMLSKLASPFCSSYLKKYGPGAQDGFSKTRPTSRGLFSGGLFFSYPSDRA